MKHQTQINLWDRRIRAGETSAVKKELFSLRDAKVARAELLTMARLARRVDLAALGLKWLNPVVRASRKTTATATVEEKAEYAICLTNVGAYSEALILLDSLKNTSPAVLLARTFALVSHWNYAETIPLMERYVESPGLSPYEALVGKANLAAALVFEKRGSEASRLVNELIIQTESDFPFLHGKILELGAQNAIAEHAWGEARRYLDRAEQFLGVTEGLDSFFLRKWRAILTVLESPPTTRTIEDLSRVREEARARRHWETVRQCDAYVALATQDEALALHVFCGTPHESFRNRMRRDFPFELQLPDEYPLPLGRNPGDSPALRTLCANEKRGLKGGQALHRMLLSIAQDFYHPPRLPTLHTLLFPQEYFNPASSPGRVHQLVRRLRRWIESRRLPLKIREEDRTYRLEATRPCRLVVPLRPSKTRSDHLTEILRARFGPREFGAASAAKHLGISRRATVSLLKEAVEHNGLRKAGNGARTRYAFSSENAHGLEADRSAHEAVGYSGRKPSGGRL